MSKKDELLDFYRAVLRSASLEAEDNGAISAVTGNDVDPKLIDGQRLVLPTKAQLSNPDWADRIVFHPIEENILRGESKIIENLRRDMNIKVNLSAMSLVYELMTLAASKASHAKLNPDQLEILTLVPEASEKDLEFLRALFKKMPFDKPSESLVSFYIKRGGKAEGKGWRRLGVASFPLFTELTSGEPKVLGVKPPSTKVRDNVTKLLNYIIPNMNTPEIYNRGSDDDTAPYFDALLRLFRSIASPINDAVLLFANVLDDSDKSLLEADWYDAASDLGQFRRLIPAMKGNSGSSPEGDDEPAAPAPAAAHTPVTTASLLGNYQPVVAAPAAAVPAAAPVGANGKVSFSDLMRASPQLQQSYQQPNSNALFPPAAGSNGGVMPGAGTPVADGNWLHGNNNGGHMSGSFRI